MGSEQLNTWALEYKKTPITCPFCKHIWNKYIWHGAKSNWIDCPKCKYYFDWNN